MISSIANCLASVIGTVLGSYKLVDEYQSPRIFDDCERDIAALMEQIAAKEKELTEAAIQEQKAKMNAFKNGEIDENSAFYKEYIKKYEYELDLKLFKYRCNDHFTTTQSNIDFKVGSFSHSSRTNHINGRTSVDINADAGIGIQKGSVGLKAKVKSGFSFVLDKGGNFHPVDLRLGVEGAISADVLKLSGGIETSVARGSTKVYAKLELTGNAVLDKYKEKHLSDTEQQVDRYIQGQFSDAHVKLEMPNLDLWNGEYEIKY
jgi:hypothetical protein